MARLAFQYALFAMAQRESMLAQLSWYPCIRRVAVFTLQAKEPSMDLGFSMALVARGRSAFENPASVSIYVTGFARAAGMPSC